MELLLQFPVVCPGVCEGSFRSLGVEAALNSIAKLGIAEILVGALRWFTVTEGRAVLTFRMTHRRRPPSSYIRPLIYTL